MLKYRRIVQESARRIAKAANRTVRSYAIDEVEEETDFTGEMLGRMKEAMHGFRTRGVRWTAKILTSHRSNAQESTFGADFIGVVTFDLPDYKVTKGFLAQAKRIEHGGSMRSRDWERLVGQCKRMLDISPEAFVFLYSPEGISVIPAVAIVSAQRCRKLAEFYSRSAVRFYEDHFECFVGDLRINSADIKTLESLRVANSLYLEASGDEPE